MQIAIDYTPAIAQTAGIGRYARELVAALARIDSINGYTLFSAQDVAPGSDVIHDLPMGANVRLRITPIGERRLTQLWQRAHIPLRIEWLAGAAQIFHALDFTLPPTRMRRVVTIHDLAFVTHPECAVPSLVAYLTQAVRRAVLAADAIITVSEHTRTTLLRWLPGVPPERVTAIPLGVGARFAPVTDPARLRAVSERFGLADAFILSVGTLEPRKNYPALIRAFAQARRMAGGPQQLVIAGRHGWLAEDIHASITAHGVSAWVRIIDNVADGDLPALYSLAGVVAQLSHTEGFGLPTLEAMRCGVPVIISDGGALPEVAGDAALVVAPADPAAIAHALVQVLNAPSLREELTRRGSARAAQFTWEATAARTLRVYESLAPLTARRVWHIQRGH
ncbi:MAG: glycosyltransferase family 4 protein [Ktedonobacterales bacterium]|nr:glycosyltransferase family 4 protein [Ktedonobacterales bacterium]